MARSLRLGQQTGCEILNAVYAVPAAPIRDAAVPFLRGEASVLDFTYAFRAAINLVTVERPIEGMEVELFDLLERWEQSGWAERPEVVDQLRSLVKQL